MGGGGGVYFRGKLFSLEYEGLELLTNIRSYKHLHFDERKIREESVKLRKRERLPHPRGF